MNRNRAIPQSAVSGYLCGSPGKAAGEKRKAVFQDDHDDDAHPSRASSSMSLDNLPQEQQSIQVHQDEHAMNSDHRPAKMARGPGGHRFEQNRDTFRDQNGRGRGRGGFVSQGPRYRKGICHSFAGEFFIFW